MKVDYLEWLFRKTRIFHMTHINNLENILKSGFLYPINELKQNHESIASEEVQERRALKKVTQPPHGVLHDYVPFYFAPRSPMLYVNHKKAERLPNAKPQHEIIYFVTYAESIHQNKRPYVFYDMHPVKEYGQCYNDIKDLPKIEWDLFFEKPLVGEYSKHWKDRSDNEQHPKWINRKGIRQAEFLIHKKVDLQDIIDIVTMTDNVKNIVNKMVDQSQLTKKLHILMKKEWYY